LAVNRARSHPISDPQLPGRAAPATAVTTAARAEMMERTLIVGGLLGTWGVQGKVVEGSVRIKESGRSDGYRCEEGDHRGRPSFIPDEFGHSW
jgi:hypothetical protein